MIASGQTIGNYRILSKIGTGGMGAVYLAEHPLIGKRVALKVIHRELANNREVVQRFFQEARAVNKIGNEHIVEIHDFGVTPENDHFYIMEYLEGRTLASILARDKRIPAQRALHIGAQIANALAAAHNAGVIHRDLKPDNIMLMTRLGDPDFVKVLDFGLAKMFAEHASAVKTAAGVLLGTPQYMSPEACESRRDIDHRTDIYALGILLFQMMTGVLPFDGESMGEVLVAQVTKLPPAPRGLNPEIPPSVEQILLRCLAKHPDGRFATMLALREALLDPEAYLRTSPPMAPARSVSADEMLQTAKTTVMHSDRVLPNGALPLPAGPTVVLGADAAASGSGSLKRSTTAVPGLAPPAEAKNNTMRIATPLGYSSRPPRRVWPVVLVIGLLLGLGGGAFAVAWFGREDDARAETSAPPPKTATGSAAPLGSAPPADASSAAVADAASAAIAKRWAKVSIDSVPSGATLVAPDGTTLGNTPLEIDWPVSEDEVAFELRLAGYRKKEKRIVVSGNTSLQIPLERIPPRGPKRRRGSSDTGLMRPE